MWDVGWGRMGSDGRRDWETFCQWISGVYGIYVVEPSRGAVRSGWMWLGLIEMDVLCRVFEQTIC